MNKTHNKHSLDASLIRGLPAATSFSFSKLAAKILKQFLCEIRQNVNSVYLYIYI